MGNQKLIEHAGCLLEENSIAQVNPLNSSTWQFIALKFRIAGHSITSP
jgi:hypothetical protein